MKENPVQVKWNTIFDKNDWMKNNTILLLREFVAEQTHQNKEKSRSDVSRSYLILMLKIPLLIAQLYALNIFFKKFVWFSIKCIIIHSVYFLKHVRHHVQDFSVSLF